MNFNEATVVRQVDSHTYTANLSGDWVIGAVPHGGYVTSVIQQVIRKHFSTTLKGQNQPHPLTLHLDFLRRTSTGPATFKVKDVKLGRQTSTVHVSLSQESEEGKGDLREEVVGYFNNSNIANESGLSFVTKWELSPPAPQTPPDFQAMLRGDDPVWAERHAWPRPDFRRATQHMRTWFPRRESNPVTSTGNLPALCDTWYRWRDPSVRFTNESLGFLCDMFPQLVEKCFFEDGTDIYSPEFEQAHSPEKQIEIYDSMPRMWYPTLLMNIEVKKALPDEGVEFIFQRVQAKSMRNGRYDLEVILMDAEGDLVALSHHVCFSLGAERNIAKRRPSDKAKSASKL